MLMVRYVLNNGTPNQGVIADMARSAGTLYVQSSKICRSNTAPRNPGPAKIALVYQRLGRKAPSPGCNRLTFSALSACPQRTIRSMPILDQVQKDMVTAMKAKDESRLSALRMVKTALKKQEVDSMKPLDEPAEMAVMNTLLKQRRESAEMFQKGGRAELAEKEEAEIKIIESYLPAGASPHELEAAVAAAIAETGATAAKQMGLVMKAAQAKLAGKRIDGKALSELVKAKLPA